MDDPDVLEIVTMSLYSSASMNACVCVCVCVCVSPCVRLGHQLLDQKCFLSDRKSLGESPQCYVTDNDFWGLLVVAMNQIIKCFHEYQVACGSKDYVYIRYRLAAW